MTADLTTVLAAVLGGLVLLVVLASVIYAWRRTVVARGDRTFITETDEGFKRALRGTKVLWNPDEAVLKGATAPAIAFVARDPATGEWREKRLLDERTGAVNLRVQTCCPRPFKAATKDDHHFLVEARVNFQLDADRLVNTYHVQDFASALEARILAAFRNEIGKYNDEEVRARGAAINEAVSRALGAMESRSDETTSGDTPFGVPLGLKIYDASFDYTELSPDDGAAMAAGASAMMLQNGAAANGSANGTGMSHAGPARVALPGVDPSVAGAGAAGVMAFRKQHLDVIADVFLDRDPASTEALLTLLEMQTRQNIAEALGRSGNLVVVTTDELGLMGGSAARETLAELASSRRARLEAAETRAATLTDEEPEPLEPAEERH